MISKYVVVPVAAFAVTAGTASAFNSDLLKKLDLNLSDNQIEALEEAHDLRHEGEHEEAKEVIEDAGLDREDMKEIRAAVREYRSERREAIKEAIEDEDYEAFLEATEGSHLAEVIDTESEFERFIEAHELRQDGDHEAAKAILDELGIERPHKGKGHHKGGFGKRQTNN